MPDLLTALMDHLAGQAIVRRPETPGGAPASWSDPAWQNQQVVPPFWRAPDGGPPAPGEKKGSGNDPVTIVSAYIRDGIPRSPQRGYSDQPVVDVRIRTKNPLVGPALGKAIVDELAPSPYGVRQAWDMGGLFLVESRQWTAFSLVAADPAQGFDWRGGFLFELLVD